MPEPQSSAKESIEERKLTLEYARLEQERVFKEKELELQNLQTKKTVWTTPWTAALVAGGLGLAGTLWSSFKNLELERNKQQGTLILEAIKTGNTKQAASNLLFLDNARLINLDKEQRKSLESEAGSSNPLPSLPRQTETIDFESTSPVSATIRDSMQNMVDDYLTYLVHIGFNKRSEQFRVHLNPELKDNVYYDVSKRQLEVAPVFATSKDEVLHQYTTRILLESSDAWAASDTATALVYGISAYFTCSYQNDPLLGEYFVRIINSIEKDAFQHPYIINLDNNTKFATSIDFTNHVEDGSAWAGGFWDLRKKIGKENTDRLVYTVWTKSSSQKNKRCKRLFLLLCTY